MIEKEILVESDSLIAIYGINNVNIEKLRSLFPKIKIMARNDKLKIIGEKEEIEIFEEKFNLLVEHYNKYHSLTQTNIENLLLDIETMKNHNEKAEEIILFGSSGKAIKARNPSQFQLVEKHKKNDLIFAIGPAGTGKTYIAIALAVKALKEKKVKRIILSRPAVEAEERLGFLPGDMKDKLDPYLQPLYDALYDMLPARKLNEMMAEGIIQIAPLAFMRGRTLGNAFVILDEAQNATMNQLKMFLTRMGESSKFIVTGDITQIDLPNKNKSGLLQSEKILKDIKGISFLYFKKEDIIRHNLVKDIVFAYEKKEALNAI